MDWQMSMLEEGRDDRVESEKDKRRNDKNGVNAIFLFSLLKHFQLIDYRAFIINSIQQVN
jgi:hypothetical protein